MSSVCPKHTQSQMWQVSSSFLDTVLWSYSWGMWIFLHISFISFNSLLGHRKSLQLGQGTLGRYWWHPPHTYQLRWQRCSPKAGPLLLSDCHFLDTRTFVPLPRKWSLNWECHVFLFSFVGMRCDVLERPSLNIFSVYHRIQKIPRLLVAAADGYLYLYNLDPQEGGECTLMKQHK